MPSCEKYHNEDTKDVSAFLSTDTHGLLNPSTKIDGIECAMCSSPNPADVCCFACDPNGVPFHDGKCWTMMPIHKEGRGYRIHRPAPITSLVRLHYLNEPNKQTSIPDSKFKDDKSNCFIEFKGRFQLGDRAFPLLPPRSDHGGVQYPSFVSFVGRSMHGKSFLIRALQYREAAGGHPVPIPSPGAKERNHDSTSSDIHLYADLATASAESPILFLDCEGFDGADVPSSLKAEGVTARPLVKTAYPRVVYAFSTCVVFVASCPLGGSDDIKEQLKSHASQGARGSRNQGFKPSLFVVFNHFEGGEAQDFDWSIDASSKAFLDNDNLAILHDFYSRIRVVYIPRMNSAKAAIALQQLDAFDHALRVEHKAAFRWRRAFGLDFTPAQLTPLLQRALDRLSKDSDAVVDWALEAPLATFASNQSQAILVDLWSQYLRYHTHPTSLAISYNNVRAHFQKHLTFCLRLCLSRNQFQVGNIPPQWDEQIRQLFFEYDRCGTSYHGRKCKKVRYRHGEYHEDFRANRWRGEYERDKSAPSPTFRESFEATLQRQPRHVSLKDLWREVPKDIQSVVSCLGCLQEPPNTVLACGHGFCFNCIRDLTDNESLPHRLQNIHCPIHRVSQTFSPRLLPIQSGCRILSLDGGGGVKGLAQLVLLSNIEKKCFDVPVIHLFDLVVGTSIGGQVALALTIGKPSGPLTVAAAMNEFPELMRSAFDPKFSPLPAAPLFFNKTRYKATTLENHLKRFFGEEKKLYSAPTSSQWSVPNVAVTTTVLGPQEVRLVTNYNRTPLGDTLLFGPTPKECMPVWAAARCTSAASPHFKPLEWQGQMLFDGGFKLNCPAIAYSEAKSIWPSKHRDILLSLGTGTTRNHTPSDLRTPFGIVQAVAGDMTDAQRAWGKFLDGHSRSHNLFRLNPVYHGTGFKLHDVKKLKDIQKQTEEWILTKDGELSTICDRLIAALFFFCPSSEIHDGVQVGEILCRLPPEECQKLVVGILRTGDLFLFAVKYNGKTFAEINVSEVLRGLRSTDELRLEVTRHGGALATGNIKIDVEMRRLGKDARSPWLPISGSPYIVRKKLHGLNHTDTFATLRAPSYIGSDPRGLTPVTRPTAFIPEPFGSDRREEALLAIQEEMRLQRRLEVDDPAAINPNLASSLHTISIHLSDLGRREEALRAIQEAVKLRQLLAADHPTSFNPDLASSLKVLSIRLSDLGRREEALRAVERAVELYRRLSADSPATFNSDLASSLNNLSTGLLDLGRREAALEVMQEAVRLYRRLAADDPATFNPDLASSLKIFFILLSDLGHREEALPAIEEAVGLYRRLSADAPATFNSDLASSLNNLSTGLLHLRHQKAALDVMQEAVRLYRRLAADDSAMFNPHLASSLKILSIRRSDFGHREDALSAIQQAVELYRRLAADFPAAFNSDLASSLNNLSICLSDMGRQEDAEHISKEAANLARRVATGM